MLLVSQYFNIANFKTKRGDFMCECEVCRRKKNRDPLNREFEPKNEFLSQKEDCEPKRDCELKRGLRSEKDCDPKKDCESLNDYSFSKMQIFRGSYTNR